MLLGLRRRPPQRGARIGTSLAPPVQAGGPVPILPAQFDRWGRRVVAAPAVVSGRYPGRALRPDAAPFVVTRGARAAPGFGSAEYVQFDGGTVVNQQDGTPKNRRYPSQADNITRLVKPVSLRWVGAPAQPPIRSSGLLIGLPLALAPARKTVRQPPPGVGNFERPATSADATVVAEVLTATVSVQTAVASGSGGDAGVTADVVSAAFSQPAAATTGGAIVTAVELAATFAVQAPTATGTASVTAAELTAAFSVPAATVTGAAEVSPAALTAAFGVQDPVATGESDAVDGTAAPAVVMATFSVADPAVSGSTPVPPTFPIGNGAYLDYWESRKQKRPKRRRRRDEEVVLALG